MPEHIVSRAVLLELRRDRAVVEEGYRFLDEKRITLAHELLRRLVLYQALMARWQEMEKQARAALAAAVARHGLEGLQVYPVPPSEFPVRRRGQQPFLGITLISEVDELERTAVSQMDTPPSNPTAEADVCADRFVRLVQQATTLALARANLLRLRDEYKRTERRVRSLENVIIPEMRAEERDIEDKLDENDLEEVIRAHLFIAGHGRELKRQ